MEYKLSPTRPQSFRLETLRSMDKSRCQHMRLLQAQRGIYRHMILMLVVVGTRFLPRTRELLPEEQARETFLLSPEEIFKMLQCLYRRVLPKVNTQRYRYNFNQAKN